VRSQADVEETRLRLALMTLAGCSISFSDELQYLPPSRIRMMQQCLPPGAPPMKPLDLFERAFPSIWHVHCRQAAEEWEVVGLFNFENQPEQRTVDFNALGLPADVKQMVFEFWEEKFVGIHQGRITLTLPPQTSRVLSIRRLTNRPQLIATDMHLFQGFHELKQQAWDEKSSQLSGEYERMPGLDSKAFFYVPASYEPRFEFPLTKKSARLTNVGNGIWMQEIHFDAARMAWSIPFQKSASETPRQL
jgi:hypothetical protein